jgi:signal transduction histidine kinase
MLLDSHSKKAFNVIDGSHSVPLSRWVLDWLTPLLLTALLYLFAFLAERILSAPFPTRGTIWWSSGIALAMAYFFGRPALLGVFVGEWLVTSAFLGRPVWLGAITGIGNTVEAGLGSWVLYRCGFSQRMGSLRDVRNLFAASAIAPTIMLVFQAGATWLNGGFRGRSMVQDMAGWYANDAMAIVYVLPFACAVRHAGEMTKKWVGRYMELLFQLLSIVLVTLLAFGTPNGFLFSGLSALAFAIVVWTSLRFDPWTTSIALMIYALVITCCMVRNLDPFPHDAENAFPHLHLLLLVAAVMAHLLSAVVAEREKAYQRIQQSAHWELVGLLSSGIAHQMNNQLTVVLGTTEMARNIMTPASPAYPVLDPLAQAVDKMSQLVDSLLAYSGRGKLLSSEVSIDVAEIVREAVYENGGAVQFGDLWKKEPVRIKVDPTLLRLAVRNLVQNAIESSKEKVSQVVVQVYEVELAFDELGDVWPLGCLPGKYIAVHVADNGDGMSPDVKAQMFEPFFTTKFLGRGLGLASVVGLVRQYGAGVRVQTEQGAGTKVELLLPKNSLK